MRVLQLFLSLILLTTTCFGQYLKPLPGMPFVNRTHKHARGLVAYWPMNERSGDKVFDLSGNGNTGTIGSGLNWGPGLFGSVIDSTNGVSQGIDITGITTGTNWSIITWSKTTRTAQQFLIDSFSGRIILGQKLAGKIGLYDGGWHYSNIETRDGLWHQVCAVSNGTQIQLYVDGIKDLDEAANNAFSFGGATYIGVKFDVDSNQAWDGPFGPIMIYNRVLSAGEIVELYREPFGMFQKDNTALIASAEAPPAPTGGQFIMIQMSAIPLVFIFAFCFVMGRKNV